MKATLRYLLMVVAMVSVLGVCAQNLAKQPEAQMHSTSTMVGTGTSLPFAAAEGTFVTGSTPCSYSPAGRPGHIRRDVGGGGTTEDDDDDPDVPVEPNPVGDVFWPLALLALAYLITRARRHALNR